MIWCACVLSRSTTTGASVSTLLLFCFGTDVPTIAPPRGRGVTCAGWMVRTLRTQRLAYYRSLASLVRDPTVRAKKLNPTTKTGTASLPLDDLLSQQEAWLAAVTAYLRVLADATNS